MDHSNRPLTFWDFQGHYSQITIEEVLARRLNGWRGWACSAGVNGIYIGFDGDVYVGTCKVGDSYGNVFEDFELPKQWVNCSKQYCMCGVDMALPKVKDRANVGREVQAKENTFPEGVEAVTNSDALQLNTPVAIVNWDLGRRCNFDCSYCIPEVHNKREPFKDFKMLKPAVDRILEKFVGDRKAKFYLAGGEPTIYPGFLDLVKYLYSKGHQISVTTNGSHKMEMYAELIKYAHVAVSVHFEFVKEDRLIENVQAMVRTLMRSQLSRRPIFSWLGVRLMMPPGQKERALGILRRLYKIPGFHLYASLGIHPIWRPENPEELYDYDQDELKFFSDCNSEEALANLARPKFSRFLRGFFPKNSEDKRI